MTSGNEATALAKRPSHRLAFQERHAGADDAGLLQAVDAPPARRGRQPDPAGDLRQRHAGIVLQAIQNLLVEGIQR
jgi:hypothetical protein